MAQLTDRRNTDVVEHPVFVDRTGRRRQLVIGAGVLVAGLLVAWLAILIISVFALLAPGVPAAAGVS